MEQSAATPETPRREAQRHGDGSVSGGMLAIYLACAAVVAYFFFFVPASGSAGGLASLPWLKSTWNHETDYEHGFLVLIIMAGLIGTMAYLMITAIFQTIKNLGA